MANKEVFDLPENTSPTLGDVIPNQTNSSGGTTSKTTFKDIMKLLGAGNSTFRGCVLYKTGDQSVSSSGSTIIEWDATTFDFGGYADIANNKVIIPDGEDGVYLVVGHVQLQNQSTGSDWYIAPSFTTSEQEVATSPRWGRGMALQSTIPGKQGSQVQYLAAGDEVGLIINNDDGSYIIRNDGAYLAVIKLSGAAVSNSVLQSASANNDASLEFDVSALNGSVEFILESIAPATDGADLTIEVSDDNGSTWESTSYQWANGYEESDNNPAVYGGQTSTQSGNTDAIYITGSIGSASGEGAAGKVQMDNPANASLYKNFLYEMGYLADGGQSLKATGSGMWKGSTNAITNVRFKFDSGNIESGTIKMIDPTAARAGEPSLFEDSEVKIPGEWWQDPNNTSDYYPKYRKVVDLGALPDSGNKSVAHGLTNVHWDSLTISGSAYNPGSSSVHPINKPDPGDNAYAISCVLAGTTNLRVETGSDRTSYTGLAILEYAKTTDTPVTRDQAYGNGGGGASPLTTKGDIWTYTTEDARLPVGSNGQVLQADSDEASGMKWGDPRHCSSVLEEHTASNSATLEFDVSAQSGAVEFILESIVPATDGADLYIEVSDDNGSTWESTNYQWGNGYDESYNSPAVYGGATSTATGSTNALRITGSMGSASGEGATGKVQLDNPANTSLYKNFMWEMGYLGPGGQSVKLAGSGTWKGSTNAITNVRFLFDSGNIESGTIKMIDPTIAQSGSPSLFEADEVRIPGEWWQDPDNTSDYYPKYRKVVDLGALPDATTKDVAHGLTNVHWDSLTISGSAYNSGSSYVQPINTPDPSSNASAISCILAGTTNLEVETGVDRTSYTGLAILEYAKTTDTPVTRAQAYGNGGGARLISPVRYTTDAGQSIPDASGTVVDFEDKEYDDDNTVTTGGSWVFTAPKDMYVNVSAAVTLSSRTWTDGELAQLNVRVNGSLYALIYRDVAQTSENRRVTLAGSADVKLSYGDTLDIQLYQSSGSPLAIDSITGFNWVSIHEIPTSL